MLQSELENVLEVPEIDFLPSNSFLAPVYYLQGRAEQRWDLHLKSTFTGEDGMALCLELFLQLFLTWVVVGAGGGLVLF